MPLTVEDGFNAERSGVLEEGVVRVHLRQRMELCHHGTSSQSQIIWEIQSHLIWNLTDWHKSHLPIDELNIMAKAMRRFLDSDGDRQAIGDLDELREAVDRVKAYQDFQPDRFNRRELKLQLRALAQDRETRR